MDNWIQRSGTHLAEHALTKLLNSKVWRMSKVYRRLRADEPCHVALLLVTKSRVRNSLKRAFAVVDHFLVLKKSLKELSQQSTKPFRTQGQTYKGAEALLLHCRMQGYDLYAATNGITTIQKGTVELSPPRNTKKCLSRKKSAHKAE